MDPNETLRTLLQYLASNDRDGARAALEALAEWIERRGFLPVEAATLASAAPDLRDASALLIARATARRFGITDLVAWRTTPDVSIHETLTATRRALARCELL